MILSSARAAFVAALALAAIGAPVAPARANMMSACSTEIGSYCSDVSEGRGRIAACLVGYTADLGASCKSEVQAVTAKTSSNRLVPAGVRNMLTSTAATQLPQSCTADAGQLCPGVPTGDGRIFACLYARKSQVNATCSSAAEVVMKAMQ